MRRNCKRGLALLLCVVTVLSLAVLPGYAGQFHDIKDSQTSMAADVLSALGVVKGTGGGGFSPEGHLTRAQLCKMAIEVLGMGEEAKAQAYRTIFKDMKGGHWASGYVNLAAVTEIPEGSKSRLMLGLGDGNFGPDREVTYQETVTLCLRILGYSEEANRAWPHSALEAASRLGLDEGVSVEVPSAPVTRGQTALLFYNLLTTPCKASGELFAKEKLGDIKDDAILLATDATINGKSGWVVTAKDGATTAYRSAAPVDTSMLGLRGSVLLDQEGRFVTMLPDASSYITAAVSRKQGSSYLHLAGKGRYTMSKDTPVYTGAAAGAEITTYEEYMANLRTGDIVTLYLDGQGKVAGLYRAKETAESRFVVVRSASATSGMFRSLLGEEKDYTIRKNGVAISMSDIRQYDVVTYDPITKVLDVCDAKLACVYENAVPTPGSPNEIVAAGGNHFAVLADAIEDFTGRKLGEHITLLFTANGMVAGLMPGKTDISTSNALGFVNKDGHFELLNCRLTLTENIPSESYNRGSIWNLGSSSRGSLKLQSKGIYSGGFLFNPKTMTLGGVKVSPAAQVFERSPEGDLVARELSSLNVSYHADYYHRSSTGVVDMIILGTGRGGGKVYGRVDSVNKYSVTPIGANRWKRTITTETLLNGEGVNYGFANGLRIASGYCELTVSGGYITAVSYLKKIENVPSTAFFTKEGTTYVRVGQDVYEVDKDVKCFNIAASYTKPGDNPPAWMDLPWNADGEWGEKDSEWVWDSTSWDPNAPEIAKFDTLSQCRNFADTLTIYLDNTEGKVRVVEAVS